MKLRFLSPLMLLAALAAPAFAQDTFKIDAAHSQIGFRVRHIVAKTSGRFTKFDGSVKVDYKDITKSSVEVTIDAASINTDNAQRDDHLRGADFFDVAKFPTITFKSTAVKDLGQGRLEVTGVFTMHGVSKTLSFPITNAGTHAGMKPGSVLAGFVDGSLKLDREAYGVGGSGFAKVLGAEVEVTLDIEAGKI